MEKIDVVIVGAGIVGLATGYQLLRLRPDLKLSIIEKESGPAKHQTGNNSGVVHTGIYYKPNTLKAKNCLEGRKELLAYCDEKGIPYQKKHKLIVATRSEELPKLKEIWERGKANCVQGIRLLSKAEIKDLEPNVNAMEALYIPECHIIDYKQVALSLCDWIQKNGGNIVFNEPIFEVRKEGQKCTLIGKSRNYQSHFFVNCTGLHSDRMARASQGKIDHQILPFRGEYYELRQEKKDIVRGLIYPVPDPKFPFLGVHLTPMISGKVEAGPNAILAFAREGYRKSDFNWKDIQEIASYPGFWRMASKYWKAGMYEMIRSFSKQVFLRDLRRLVPSIEEKDLFPGGAGIRAQVVTKEGKLLDDFAFLQEENILHVLNAPSPAATASFSIGRTLAEMVLTMRKSRCIS